MRRYRYGDPTKASRIQWKSALYFLAAWNVLGIVVYKVYKSKKKDETPEWDKLTTTQKYMQLVTVGGNKPIEKVQMSGLTPVRTEEFKKKSDCKDEFCDAYDHDPLKDARFISMDFGPFNNSRCHEHLENK
ncbi:uncharacterized protein LOC124289702 [Haliotis rubra]|uniref:uncharacterized protein LOC124289702 n=1 Tax=Haliotis rubra TaxID=36100 RepID=UPI001EE54108|nr:uncharacterized protein LOC124289702 [Haliotis rubra]